MLETTSFALETCPQESPCNLYTVGSLLTSTLGMDEAHSIIPLRLQVVDTIEIKLMINSLLSAELFHTDLSRPVTFYPLPVFRSPLGTRNTPRAFFNIHNSLISARDAVGASQMETAFNRQAENYNQRLTHSGVYWRHVARNTSVTATVGVLVSDVFPCQRRIWVAVLSGCVFSGQKQVTCLFQYFISGNSGSWPDYHSSTNIWE
jgi:hypothetical protein